MPIIIRSRKEGFRRCGIAHPAHEVEHPDDAFTKEQLERLLNEPTLMVRVVEKSKKTGKAAKEPEEESEF